MGIFTEYLRDLVLAIKAKTDLITTAPAVEAGGKVDAIKAKTDLITTAPAVETGGKVDAIKAKTDLISTAPAVEAGGKIDAIKAKTDLITTAPSVEAGGKIDAIKAKTDLIGGGFPSTGQVELWGSGNSVHMLVAPFTCIGTLCQTNAVTNTFGTYSVIANPLSIWPQVIFGIELSVPVGGDDWGIVAIATGAAGFETDEILVPFGFHGVTAAGVVPAITHVVKGRWIAGSSRVTCRAMHELAGVLNVYVHILHHEAVY